MATGSGLLSTLMPTTIFNKHIFYKIIYGLGSVCSQQASVAAQMVLKNKNGAIGVALVIFGQMFGSAIFISVKQNVFAIQLLQNFMKVLGLDYKKVLNIDPTVQIGLQSWN